MVYYSLPAGPQLWLLWATGLVGQGQYQHQYLGLTYCDNSNTKTKDKKTFENLIADFKIKHISLLLRRKGPYLIAVAQKGPLRYQGCMALYPLKIHACMIYFFKMHGRYFSNTCSLIKI